MSIQPGTSIGRYHIVEQLGQGGMATVYKAYDTRLERYVAIKFIRKSAISEEQAEKLYIRFEREAKALAKFSHAHIVKVYDFGEFEGSPYLVMEYLPGGTLKARTGKPMPYWEAASLILPIAQALIYAHKRGIIHRDVKPVNILLDEEGQPLLSDFGISKVLEDGESTLTGTGVGIGTPEYMAPEQGAGHGVDHRVDVYALGIVLYEFITGRKPYKADTPLATVLKHMTEPLPPARNVIQDLPQAVEAILYKALAKDPAERYQDMGAFAEALKGISQPLEESLTITLPETLPQTASEKPVPAPEIRPHTGASGVRVPPRPVTSSIQPAPLPAAGHPAPGKPGKKREKVFLTIVALIVVAGICVIGGGVFLYNAAGGYNTGVDNFYYTSSRDGKMEVYRQKIRGIAERVTYSPKDTEAWDGSPSRGMVYFVSNRDGKNEIYRINQNGVEERVTTTAAGYASWEVDTGDDKYIYFTSNRGGKAEIYRMGSDSTPEQVTHSEGKSQSFEPAKGTDGCLYFTSNRSGKNEIYRLCQAGLERVTYTSGAGDSWQAAPGFPGWVYFTSNRTGKREVFRIDPDGVVEQVTHTPGRAESWQPRRGAFGYIFFTSDRSGKQEVYYLSKEGECLVFSQEVGKGESAVSFID